MNRTAKLLVSTQPLSRATAVLLGACLSILVLGLQYLLQYLVASEQPARNIGIERSLENPSLYIVGLVLGAFAGGVISLAVLELLEIDGRTRRFNRGDLLILIFQSLMGMIAVQVLIRSACNLMGLDVDVIENATHSAVMSSVIWSAVLCACCRHQQSALRQAIPVALLMLVSQGICFAILLIPSDDPLGNPLVEGAFVVLCHFMAQVGVVLIYIELPKERFGKSDLNWKKVGSWYNGTNPACIGMEVGLLCGVCVGVLSLFFTLFEFAFGFKDFEGFDFIFSILMLPFVSVMMGFLTGFWLSGIIARIPTIFVRKENRVLFCGICGFILSFTLHVVVALDFDFSFETAVLLISGALIPAWAEYIRQNRLRNQTDFPSVPPPLPELGAYN